ncbi:MAG: hypothetical protein MJ240_01975 [Kiritimatiellae bacterium]|nr:hypothetical protein [Kiritimatiellia bacterium]
MNFTWTFLLVSMASLMAVAAPVAAQQEESAAESANDAMSESPGFERYKTILDRMPFGEPPPNYDPTQPPGSASAAAAAAAAAAGEMTEAERTEEQQRVASSVRVSVLNVNPSGQTMVGFTDSSVQPPEHHYIPVGVRRDGWLVKSVDASQVDDEKITLEKDGIEVTVKLGEGPQGDAKGGKRGPGGGNRPGLRGARPRLGPAAQAADTAPAGAGGAMARLRARREQQEPDEAKRRAAAAAEEKAEKERRAAEAEAAAAERQQQRDALLQIQEELRRQREEKAAQQAQEQNGADSEE